METMSWDVARSLVSRLTYKPKHSIELCIALDGSHAVLWVIAKDQPDANSSDRRVPVQSCQLIARPPRDPDELMMFVRHALDTHELHERAEWLRIGGVPVDDPHPVSA